MAMWRMHPLSLKFEDDAIERELRSETVTAASSVVMLFAVLNLTLNWLWTVGTGWATIVCTIVASTYATFAVILERAWRHMPAAHVHQLCERLWVVGWVINVSIFWYLVMSGRLSRLHPSEGHKAAAACAIWVLVPAVQHILHLGLGARACVLGLAVSIVLSSHAWRGEMLAALIVGEASGVAVDHMLRSAFRARLVRIDQLQQEKERAVYEFASARRWWPNPIAWHLVLQVVPTSCGLRRCGVLGLTFRSLRAPPTASFAIAAAPLERGERAAHDGRSREGRQCRGRAPCSRCRRGRRA